MIAIAQGTVVQPACVGSLGAAPPACSLLCGAGCHCDARSRTTARSDGSGSAPRMHLSVLSSSLRPPCDRSMSLPAADAAPAASSPLEVAALSAVQRWTEHCFGPHAFHEARTTVSTHTETGTPRTANSVQRSATRGLCGMGRASSLASSTMSLLQSSRRRRLPLPPALHSWSRCR